MKLKLNYLGFIGFLSLIGLVGIFDSESRFTLSFLASIGYFGYFFVTPDELFKKRVLQTSTIVLVFISLMMLVFYLGFMITRDVNYFTNGFWITFTTLLILFPLIFVIFEVKDAVKPE